MQQKSTFVFSLGATCSSSNCLEKHHFRSRNAWYPHLRSDCSL